MSTETTVVSYLELISQDEKEIKKESLAIKAQESSILVQKEIMELKAAIASYDQRIERAKRSIPYSVSSEFKLITEKTKLEEALSFATSILTERFADSRI